jgi:diguanylate cyclase (GGDEF)-like protein
VCGVSSATRVHSAYRLELAKDEGAKALLWTGGLILLLSVLNVVLARHGVDTVDEVHLGVVALFLLGSFVASRPSTSPVIVPWIVAAAAVVMVLSLQWEVWSDPTALGAAYVLMTILAFAPFILDVRAVLSAQVPMAIGYLLAASQLDAAGVVNWIIAGMAAILLGLVILRVRLQSIDELAAAMARSRADATRDPLTGTLNRRGIEERVPDLVALAGRREESVFAVFVDIDGLKAANDQHGHEFGDEVIRAVADAVRMTVRAGDLVGRWGGDEFIVIGMGDPLPTDQLTSRLRNRLEHSGIVKSQWPGTVSVGSAIGRAEGFDFDRLIATADADMYERRRLRRLA